MFLCDAYDKKALLGPHADCPIGTPCRVQAFTIAHIVIGLSLHIHSFLHLRLCTSKPFQLWFYQWLTYCEPCLRHFSKVKFILSRSVGKHGLYYECPTRPSLLIHTRTVCKQNILSGMYSYETCVSTFGMQFLSKVSSVFLLRSLVIYKNTHPHPGV